MATLFMKKTTAPFDFQPASFVPFRDKKVVARVRAITREQITRHRNPDFNISVLPDSEFEFRWITDMFFRIKEAMDAGRPLVAIMPNPWPGYARLADMLNRAKVDCRKLHTFNMDEYADLYADAGFTNIRTGPTGARFLSYVRGRTPAD